MSNKSDSKCQTLSLAHVRSRAREWSGTRLDAVGQCQVLFHCRNFAAQSDCRVQAWLIIMKGHPPPPAALLCRFKHRRRQRVAACKYRRRQRVAACKCRQRQSILPPVNENHKRSMFLIKAHLSFCLKEQTSCVVDLLYTASYRFLQTQVVERV